MHRFLIRRFTTILFLVLLLTVIIFALATSTGAGVERIFRIYAESPYEIAREKGLQGVDRPPAELYFFWLGEILRGNFGHVGGTAGVGFPLNEILIPRLKVSFSVIGIALLIAVSLGFLGGVFSALRPGHALTKIFNFFNLAFLSIPDFAVGITLILIFAVTLRWLPTSGYEGILIDPTPGEFFLDRMKHLILPSLTLSLSYIATFADQVRVSISQEMAEDYIRTARSKGLAEKVVILKHAMRNGSIPILASLFSSFPFLLGGIVIVEVLFSLPGLGSFLYRAAGLGHGSDFYVVLIVTGLASFLALFASLIADFLYAFIDPRVKAPMEVDKKDSNPVFFSLIFPAGFLLIFFYHWGLFRVFESMEKPILWATLMVILLVVCGIYIQKRKFAVPRKKKTAIKISGLPRPHFNWRNFYQFCRKILSWPVLLSLFFLVFIVLASFYPAICGIEKLQDVPIDFYHTYEPPGSDFLMGTNRHGQDMLMIVLVTARDSLSSVLYATLIGVLGGVFLGILTGYLKGTLDRAVMAAFDLISSVPSFFLVFLVIGVVGSSLAVIILTVSVFGLVETTRVVRARVLVYRELQFVEAARATGNTELQIAVKHIFPNIFSVMWSRAAILFGKNMLILSSLGYLRIIPATTWGTIVGENVRASLYYWWTTIFPILFIFLTVIAVNIIGKGVQKAIDPFKQEV